MSFSNMGVTHQHLSWIVNSPLTVAVTIVWFRVEYRSTLNYKIVTDSSPVPTVPNIRSSLLSQHFEICFLSGSWSYIARRDSYSAARWCSGYYVLLTWVSGVALLVWFHIGVIYFFVIHMGSMVAGTTATPPPPSKDTSSIDLDMLFADW